MCTDAVLRAGGVFLNTTEDALEHYTDSSQWDAQFSEMQSSAILPLADKDELMGFLLIDSREELFFTERRQRIARAWTNQVSSILSKKRADFLIERRKKQAERLSTVKADVAQALIEASQMGSHCCPVKYFAQGGKSCTIKRMAGIWPKNDLN